MTGHPTTVKGAVFAEFDRATRPREGGGANVRQRFPLGLGLVGDTVGPRKDLQRPRTWDEAQAVLAAHRARRRPRNRPLPPAGPPTPHVGGSGPNDPKVTA